MSAEELLDIFFRGVAVAALLAANHIRKEESLPGLLDFVILLLLVTTFLITVTSILGS